MRKSDPAVAAVTCPPVVVFKSEPDAMDEIHKFVELAVVAVIIVVLANGRELAMPSPRIVVVAVLPTYKMSYTDAMDDVALVNVWSAVQVFAFPVFRESVPALPPTSAPKVPE